MANGWNMNSARMRLSHWCAADGSSPVPTAVPSALEVEDFDARTSRTCAQNNVKFRMDPMPTPVCHMAMIFDPDGNSICIHKRNSDRA